MARTPLRDRVVAITGAGSGIGRALARALDARGCRLALADIDGAAAVATAESCRHARPHHLDVRDRAAVQAWAGEVAASFGRVDVAVNNAGVALAATALEQDADDLDWVLDVNLRGVVHGSQAFLPHLAASGDGHLVNISSVFGLVGMLGQSAYSASKFGVRGYSESVAIEMRSHGHPVQVHVVHPGGIRTSIADSARVARGRDRAEVARFFDERLARMAPDRAAEHIVRGIERGRSRILVGIDAHLVNLAERVLGSRYQAVVAAVARSGPLAEPPASTPHHLSPAQLHDRDTGRG